MKSRKQITALDDSTVIPKILHYHTIFGTAAETAHKILLGTKSCNCDASINLIPLHSNLHKKKIMQKMGKFAQEKNYAEDGHMKFWFI